MSRHPLFHTPLGLCSSIVGGAIAVAMTVLELVWVLVLGQVQVQPGQPAMPMPNPLAYATPWAALASLILGGLPYLVGEVKDRRADRARREEADRQERREKAEREMRQADLQSQIDRQKADAVEQRREAAEAKARAEAAEAKAHQAAAEAKVTKGRLEELESKTYQVADKVEATVDKVVATQTVAAGNQGDLEGLKERMQKQGTGVGGAGPILQGQTRLLPTILVVEDDKDTMEVTCKRFSAAGFSVTKAPDLSEASYQIAKGPHWVFTDVKLLGGQDGLDLIRLIRRDELPINVVVCSGYVDDPSIKVKLDELRPDVVVGKPLMDADFDRLLDRMRAAPRAAGRGGGRSDGPRPA